MMRREVSDETYDAFLLGIACCSRLPVLLLGVLRGFRRSVVLDGSIRLGVNLLPLVVLGGV